MKRVVFVLTTLLLAAIQPQQAPAQTSPMDLVKRAIAAAGGEQTLRRLQALAFTGEAKHWEPEQSLIAGGVPRFVGDSTFTVTWNLANGTARTDWRRSMQYPVVEKLAFSEVLTPRFGFVVDDKGSRAMSGIRVAAELRELARTSPVLLLKALDSPGNVTAEGAVRFGNELLPAVALKDGGTRFIIMFDRTTHLPAVVRTRDDDSVHGDTSFDLKLEDWKPVAGAMLAHSLTYQLNDVVVTKLAYKNVTANPTIEAAAFAASDAVKAAAKAPAGTNVPYQWVLRALSLGSFLDSDQVFVPPGGSLKLVELAPNVQQVVGGSYNSLIVAMKDGLAVFDAPVNEEQSRWTINAAKAKYGRPVKYLVLTHHHADHAGGTRTYMAEGATIIVPAPDRKYFLKIAMVPHTVAPDELERAHKSPEVVEVKDQMSVKDGTEEIRLYRIANQHVDGMLIAHIVAENIVWVTDLWSPGRDTERTADALALRDAVKRLGITSALFAGGEGSTARQSDLEKMFADK